MTGASWTALLAGCPEVRVILSRRISLPGSLVV